MKKEQQLWNAIKTSSKAYQDWHKEPTAARLRKLQRARIAELGLRYDVKPSLIAPLIQDGKLRAREERLKPILFPSPKVEFNVRLHTSRGVKSVNDQLISTAAALSIIDWLDGRDIGDFPRGEWWGPTDVKTVRSFVTHAQRLDEVGENLKQFAFRLSYAHFKMTARNHWIDPCLRWLSERVK